MKDSVSKDYSISLVRFLAMVAIFVAHILQFFRLDASFWLTSAVQVFLFISGYLYSKKNISNTISFYKKNLLKILIPCYAFLIPVLVIGVIFAECSMTEAIKIMLTFNTDMYAGIINLWFVPYIVLCYLVTPVLQKILDSIENSNYCINCIVATAVFFVIFQLIPYFSPSIMICYFAGMIYKRMECMKYINIINTLCIFASVICVIAIVYVDKNIIIDSLLLNGVYDIFLNISKLFIAISSFILIRKVYFSINIDLSKILQWSDRYSYCVYLSHQIFILGSFSVFYMINNVAMAIVIIIVFTGLTSFTIDLVSRKIFCWIS